ncbi:uncharacterized protein K441DRAFT_569545, partial [Cenococcum geophilum 1.58]|uniref:uncharacterized protein n=1 Tax=Cenococcum geophilum 1.58 TaxID=794803 RepID=UPI00358E887F
FNPIAYREAIIRLLIVDRVAFSTVKWPVLRQLALAYNPAIKSYLVASRHSTVRLIALNYDLYLRQLQTSLAQANGLIYI